MNPRTALLLFFFSVFLSMGFCQEKPAARRDTVKIYSNIEGLSKKNRLSQLLYGLIFRSPSTGIPLDEGKNAQNISDSLFRCFKGKPIRNIRIVIFDPFGYSLEDDSVRPRGFFNKTANRLHFRTLPFTISNLLLFGSNDVFDSLLIVESERLIRGQQYIHDARIVPKLAGSNSDSVDLTVRVQDVWSLSAEGELTGTRLSIKLEESSMLGLGHEFGNRMSWNHTNGKTTYSTYYNIPNIKNTYINAYLQYRQNEDNSSLKGISLERPFFSPLASWAGGLLIAQEVKYPQKIATDSSAPASLLNHNTRDIWAARSWQIKRETNATARTNKLIASARYLHHQNPALTNSTYPLLSYPDEDLFLGGIGLSSRSYAEVRYLSHFGKTEDIAVGQYWQFVGGYQLKNKSDRWYLGGRYAYGNFFRWGYLSGSLEYGGFISRKGSSDRVLSIGSNYFSKLMSPGKWKLRHFLGTELLVGTGLTQGDSLSLTNEFGFPAFHPFHIAGSRRLQLSLRTQAYPPWDLLGFHFGPYVICSIGMLGNEASGFSHSRLYSRFGIGINIRNDLLVFNTFQVSLVFYPEIPGKGDNLFDFGPNSIADSHFRDFSLGKPGRIEYR